MWVVILWLGCCVPAWGQGVDSLTSPVAVPRVVAVELLQRSLRVAALDSLVLAQREEVRLLRLGLRTAREEAFWLRVLVDTLEASVRDLKRLQAAQVVVIRQQEQRFQRVQQRNRWRGRWEGISIGVLVVIIFSYVGH